MQSLKEFSTECGTFCVDTEKDRLMTSVLATDTCVQKDVLDVLLAFTKPGDTFVDIGAHIGTVSIPMALKGAKVISFEPSDDAFPLLTSNAKLNNVSIDIRKKGVGEKRGDATLQTGVKGNAGSRSLVEGGDVVVVPLDDEITHADTIKIDVEGMELYVLRGAEQLITKSQPIIVFEMNGIQMSFYKTKIQSVESFFRDHGYRLFLNKKGTLWEIGSLSLVTRLQFPGSLFGRGYLFDTVAIPIGREIPLPVLGVSNTLLSIIGRKTKDLAHRYFAIKI